MAKQNRKQRRAAASKARKNNKGKSGITAAVKTTPDAKWNANAPTIKRAVAFTVNGELVERRLFIVTQFRYFIEACRVHAMAPKHSAKLYALINASTKGVTDAYNVNATRASEVAAVLKLFDWQCVDELFGTVKEPGGVLAGKEFAGLTFEKLVRIARAMRGSGKRVAIHEKSMAKAPSVAKLVKAMNDAGGKGKGKGGKGKRGKRNAMPGMPGDPVKALGYIKSRIVHFRKTHGALLDKKHAPLLAAMIENAEALFTPLREGIKAAQVNEAKNAE